jgi:hypothetical protein
LVVFVFVWTAVEGEHFAGHGAAPILTIDGSVLSWPVLLVSGVCTI